MTELAAHEPVKPGDGQRMAPSGAWAAGFWRDA